MAGMFGSLMTGGRNLMNRAGGAVSGVGNIANAGALAGTGTMQAQGMGEVVQQQQNAFLGQMQQISQAQNANTLATAQMESESQLVQALAKKLVQGAKAIKDLIQ